MTPEEHRAWEAWQKDHPDNKDCKRWHELPYWVQKAYLHYLEAE